MSTQHTPGRPELHIETLSQKGVLVVMVTEEHPKFDVG